jgi:branched-chain amino acid transport system substrate-binding protein
VKNKFSAVIWLINFALILMLLTSCEEDKTIKVGFSGQLSGIYSDLGVQGRNGVQLAIEDMNEAGGIDGRELVLFAENDKNNVKGAIEADRALIGRGVATIIGHMTSSQTLGVLPVIEDAGIPLISPTSSTLLLSGKKDNVFRLNSSSSMTAAVLGRYAAQSLELRKVGLIYDLNNEAYSMPYTLEFKRTFEEEGGQVLLQFPFSSGEDFRWEEVLQDIKEQELDSLFLIASARDTAFLAQSFKKEVPDIQFLGSGWAFTEDLLTYGGRAVEGLIFADSFFADLGVERYRIFHHRYVERFGKIPGFAASQAYESVLLLAEGIRRSRNHEGDLVAALQSVRNIEGLMGTLQFTEYGDVIRPFYISRVEQGKFRLLGSMGDR